MRFRSLAAALLALPFCFVSPTSAHADDILYSYQGSGEISGGFTYLSTTGFLTFDTGVISVTSGTDIRYGSYDLGTAVGFEFESPSVYTINATGGGLTSFANAYNLDTIGTQTLNVGTLTISDVSSSVTPEPSSFMLLGTGLLGMLGVAKRRFV